MDKLMTSYHSLFGSTRLIFIVEMLNFPQIDAADVRGHSILFLILQKFVNDSTDTDLITETNNILIAVSITGLEKINICWLVIGCIVPRSLKLII